MNTPAPNLLPPPERRTPQELAAVQGRQTKERLALAPVLELVPAKPGSGRAGASRAMLGVTAAVILVAVLGMGGWMFAGWGEPSAPAAGGQAGAAAGGLRIESLPPGAHVIVDGDPSGLKTPAVLDGLRAGQTLEVQLQKEGYQTVTRRIEVSRGAPNVHRFALVEDWGVVVLEGLPKGVKVFVDDAPAEDGERLSMAIGKRRLRIESTDDVLYAGELDVVRGEQRLTVPPKARNR